MDLKKLIETSDSLRMYGLIVERDTQGNLRANVPHVRCHSPAGYECGYAGSGPADLALSVMHALIPPLPEADEEAQYELEGAELDRACEDLARWST